MKTSVCEINIGHASITVSPITRNSGAIKKFWCPNMNALFYTVSVTAHYTYCSTVRQAELKPLI